MSGRSFLSRLHPALLLLALLGTGATGAACDRTKDEPPAIAVATRLASLDAEHEPLRGEFNRDAGRPRIVVLASPS